MRIQVDIHRDFILPSGKKICSVVDYCFSWLVIINAKSIRKLHFPIRQRTRIVRRIRSAEVPEVSYPNGRFSASRGIGQTLIRQVLFILIVADGLAGLRLISEMTLHSLFGYVKPFQAVLQLQPFQRLRHARLGHCDTCVVLRDRRDAADWSRIQKGITRNGLCVMHIPELEYPSISQITISVRFRGSGSRHQIWGGVKRQEKSLIRPVGLALQESSNKNESSFV
jgi:hypothetical protein